MPTSPGPARAPLVAVVLALATLAGASTLAAPSATAGTTSPPGPTSSAAAPALPPLRCGGLALGLLVPATAGDEGARALATEVARGAQLAVDDLRRREPTCVIDLATFDTGRVGASGAAQQAVTDRRVLGVVGPTGASDAGALEVLDEGGVTMVSPSADDLGADGPSPGRLHVLVGRAGAGYDRLASHLYHDRGSRVVALVRDPSEPAAALEAAMAAELTRFGGRVVDVAPLDPALVDLGDTVLALQGERVDTVVYAGDAALGGRLAKQLHDGGVGVTFVGAWGVDDPRFLDLAGGAGEGALVVAARSHPTWEPAATGFTTAYRLAHHPASPGPYAAEAYDAAGVLLRAVTSGEVTRAGVEGYVDNLQWTGVTGPIAFDDDGRPEVALRLAEVEGGRFVPLGPLP